MEGLRMSENTNLDVYVRCWNSLLLEPSGPSLCEDICIKILLDFCWGTVIYLLLRGYKHIQP